MLLGYIAFFAFAWALMSLFYGFAIAPCLRDRARFELYALRDQLRDLALSCQAEPQSFSFRHLETMLNRMTRMCDLHNISNMVYVMLMVKVDQNTLREHQRFDAEATGQLKQIERHAIDSMVCVMFVNSPQFMLLAGMIVLTSQACKHSIELKNRLLWHDYPSISSSLVSGA